MCWKLPSMFRLRAVGAGERHAAARFTSAPASATASTRPRVDVGRVEQAADRLVDDERREDQQRHAVGLRGEDLHAPEAEGQRAPRPAARRAAAPAARSPIAAASVSMCPASESSASECASDARRDLAGHQREDQPERMRSRAAVGFRADARGSARDGRVATSPRYARAGAPGSLAVSPGPALVCSDGERHAPAIPGARERGARRSSRSPRPRLLVALKLGRGAGDRQPRADLRRDRVQRRRGRGGADLLRRAPRRPPGRPRPPLRPPPGREPGGARRGRDPARRAALRGQRRGDQPPASTARRRRRSTGTSSR